MKRAIGNIFKDLIGSQFSKNCLLTLLSFDTEELNIQTLSYILFCQHIFLRDIWLIGLFIKNSLHKFKRGLSPSINFTKDGPQWVNRLYV